MQKRGIADHFNFGLSDNDPTGWDNITVDWSMIVGRPMLARTWVWIGPASKRALACQAMKTRRGVPMRLRPAERRAVVARPAAAHDRPTAARRPAPAHPHDRTPRHSDPLANAEPADGGRCLPTDTYFSQQWGLTNKTAGINVANAWQNYTGIGVKVGVIDDGFDYNHTDLSQHYLFNLDFDTRTAATTRSVTPSPTSTAPPLWASLGRSAMGPAPWALPTMPASPAFASDTARTVAAAR